MQAEPVAASEKYAEGTDQPNNKVDGWEHLSAEEKLAAEQSFEVYCKPVEFYNFLRQRAIDKPLFLQRCLDYNLKAKHNKRILMTVTVSWRDDETRPLFPLNICLARLDPDTAAEGAENYYVSRIFTSQGPYGIDEKGNTQVQVKFVLPQLEKLAMKANTGKYYVLMFTSVETPTSLSKVNESLMLMETASDESRAGENCLYGKVSLKSLYDIWDIYPNYPLGQQTRILYRTNLVPCILTYCLEFSFRSKTKRISIQNSRDSQDQGEINKLQISLCVQELTARERYPYQIHESREVASTSSSLSHILWLKEGNVSFNYRYYNNTLQRTEVTEDFTCPFCLVRCATYKGLTCHLSSSHDYFDFEFLESEEGPSVYVSVKTNIWRPELIAYDVDPKEQTFIYCAKPCKRRELTNGSIGRANDTDQMLLDPEIPTGDTELLENADGSNAIMLHPDPDCVPPISDHDHGTPAVVQVDQEGVSNAIILYPGPDCVPPISEYDHGTPAVVQVDKEGVSNAIILHPGLNCVPPIFEHDHGTPPVVQVDKEGVSNAIILHPGLDCVPPISEHDHGTPAVVQVDMEGVSNSIILHPGLDCVPPISEHDHGTPAAIQVDKEGISNAIILHPGPDCVPPISEHDDGTPAVRQVDKGKKLLIENHDPQIVARLKKRKFYHSHKYQPMELEEVLVDEDSEDEINEGAQEIEDRRKIAMLDVSDDAKRFLLMWNSFVKKHRVLADGHMNWAYEAFTKHHGAELAQSPALAMNWRLFMIKLLDHGLLGAGTIHKCTTILEEYQKQN